jgi:hypothetical protein
MAQNIVAIEKQKKSMSYLHVIAQRLLDLMASKADPNQKSPTHYTSLRWLVAFGDAFFDGNMEWLKRHEPFFSTSSWSTPRVCYVCLDVMYAGCKCRLTTEFNLDYLFPCSIDTISNELHLMNL